MVASPSSYSLRCSSLQNRPVAKASTILRIFVTGFVLMLLRPCLLILGATKIPPCAMAVARTHPVTLSIEQQTIPTQSAERQPLVYQFPTCLPLAICAVEMNFRHKTVIGLLLLAMPSRAFTNLALLASKPHVSGSSSRNQAYGSRNASLWTSHWAWGGAAINALDASWTAPSAIS